MSVMGGSLSSKDLASYRYNEIVCFMLSVSLVMAKGCKESELEMAAEFLRILEYF